jgi:flagellar biosynthesis protein
MKPPRKAVAIKYDQTQDRAPRVVAKGKSHLAEKIIAAARENGIPLVEDRNLAQILEALELETEIPPELYRAMAEVLAFVYQLNDHAGK